MYLIVNKQPVKYQGEVTDWTQRRGLSQRIQMERSINNKLFWL